MNLDLSKEVSREVKVFRKKNTEKKTLYSKTIKRKIIELVGDGKSIHLWSRQLMLEI